VRILCDRHYVRPRPTSSSVTSIKAELRLRLDNWVAEGKLLEAQRR